ncbi:MAG: hypothetical protein KDI63_03915 [Gammaproteobacteria bacterium]|nr:hypothetical protein [Gammaproteobacteria bacterium]
MAIRVPRAAILLSTVLVVLVVLVLAQPALLKVPLLAVLSHASGLDWRVGGRFHLDWGSMLGISAEQIEISKQTTGGRSAIANIGKLEATLNLAALAAGELRIPRLAVTDTEVRLDRDSSGPSYWQAAEEFSATSGTGAGSKVRLTEIGDLSLSAIRVHYQKPDLTLLDVRLVQANLSLDADKGFRAHAQALIDGQPLSLAATTESPGISAQNGQALPVSASLRLAAAELEVSGLLGWPLGSADTRLTARLRGDSLSQLLNPWFRELPAEALGGFDIETIFWGSGGKMRLEGIRADLEQSRLTGEINLDIRQPRPLLTAEVHLNELPENLLVWLTPSTTSPESPLPSAVAKDWSGMRNIDIGHFQIEIGRAKYQSMDLKRLQLDGRLEQAHLYVRLHPVAAFSSHLQGELELDVSTARPEYRLRADSRRFNLDRLFTFLGKQNLGGGDIAQLELGITGSLDSPPWAGVRALTTQVSGVRLHLTPLSQDQQVTLEAEKFLAQLDPASRKIHIAAEGSVNGQPLQLTVESGLPPSQASPPEAFPLKLSLTTAAGVRLSSTGTLFHREPVWNYRIQSQLSSESLSTLGALAGLELPETGPVNSELSIQGETGGLTWQSSKTHVAGLRIQGNGQIDWSQGPAEYTLNSRINGELAHLSSLLPVPDLAHVPLNAQIELASKARSLTINVPELAVGESHGKASARVDFEGQKPKGIADIELDVLQLEHFSVAKTPDKHPTNPTRVVPDIAIPLHPHSDFDLQVTTQIDKLLHNTIDLGKYVFTTRIQGGRLEATGQLESTYVSKASYHTELFQQDGTPAVHVEIDTKDVDYGGLLRDLGISEKITGKLDLELNFNGAAHRLPGLLATGEGRLRISGGQGHLNMTSLRLWGGAMLDLLIPRLLSGRGEGVEVDCLAAHFNLREGVLRSEGIVLNTSEKIIGGALQIALPSETINGVFQPTQKGVRLVPLAHPIGLKGTLAQPQILPITGETLILLGKIAAGLVNPAYLVVLSSSLGTHSDNPCEEVLEGEQQANQKGYGLMPRRPILTLPPASHGGKHQNTPTDSAEALVPPGQ